jgi:hypothetical protein
MAAEASAVDETLTPDDAADVFEELLPAQNKSYELGLKFKLPQHVVEAIHKELPSDKCLLQILIKFLEQAERPTWRVIVDALKNPVVGLTALARRVEAVHFPDSTATRDVVPKTTDTTASAANTTAGDDDIMVKRDQPSQPATGPKPYRMPKEVKDDIDVLECEFNSLKKEL